MSLGVVPGLLAALACALADTPLATALVLERDTTVRVQSAEPAKRAQPDPAATDDDLKAIHSVLDRYAAAMEAKDIEGLKAVWPALSEDQQRKLRTGFELTRLHKVQLQVNDVQVTVSIAVANCLRRDQIVTAEGVSFQREAKATFRLVKKAETWTIVSIQ